MTILPVGRQGPDRSPQQRPRGDAPPHWRQAYITRGIPGRDHPVSSRRLRTARQARNLGGAWNKGYATEGSRALINMGFTDLGIERVFGHTMAVNTGSRRVMEKCGLTLVRTTPYEGPDAI